MLGSGEEEQVVVEAVPLRECGEEGLMVAGVPQDRRQRRRAEFSERE